MKEPDRILVTGAAGFTGRALALRLASEGFSVRGTVRPDGDHTKIEELVDSGIEIVETDIGDSRDVEKAVDGCSHVYHIAAIFRRAGIPDQEYERINVTGTGNVINACVTAGVEKMVHCSTIGVCGHIENPPGDETTPYSPGDIYQETKMEGEKVALRAFTEGRIRGVVIRPASIYGPGDLRLLKLFRMIGKRRFLVVGSGKPTFHMVYIDDLVEGFIRAMRSEAANGEVFIIAGAAELPLNDLFSQIAKTLGVPRPGWRVPAAPVQALGSIVERICIPLGIEPPIYRRRVDFFTKSRAFDISKAKSVLSYEPKVSVEEGVRRTAEWYRAEGLI